MINAGVIGGAGYTGGELLRILFGHPEVTVKEVQSTSQTGKLISGTHKDLAPITSLTFSENLNLNNLDVVFLCSGHGKGRKFIENNNIPPTTKVIDLSHDFRLNGDHKFTYGLPEVFLESIKTSQFIANPGCFATAIQLGLAPLAYAGVINNPVHITAITGSTGAGQNPTPTSHFSWRHNNLSVYKAFAHQHLSEIKQTLISMQNSPVELNFVPMRGPFPRGILASMTITSNIDQEFLTETFESFYEGKPFAYFCPEEPDLKQVTNTNFCYISAKKHGDSIHIVTAVDNLIKGASGQAVQNMNISFGLDQTKGLYLKPTIF